MFVKHVIVDSLGAPVVTEGLEVVVKRLKRESLGPPVVTVGQEVVVARPREEARLICPIRGHPTPIVEWRKVRNLVIYNFSK